MLLWLPRAGKKGQGRSWARRHCFTSVSFNQRPARRVQRQIAHPWCSAGTWASFRFPFFTQSTLLMPRMGLRISEAAASFCCLMVNPEIFFFFVDAPVCWIMIQCLNLYEIKMRRAKHTCVLKCFKLIWSDFRVQSPNRPAQLTGAHLYSCTSAGNEQKIVVRSSQKCFRDLFAGASRTIIFEIVPAYP